MSIFESLILMIAFATLIVALNQRKKVTTPRLPSKHEGWLLFNLNM